MKVYKICTYASGWINGSGWSYNMSEIDSETIITNALDHEDFPKLEIKWFDIAGFEISDYETIEEFATIDETDTMFTIIVWDVTESEDDPVEVYRKERWLSDIAKEYVDWYNN